MIEVDSYVRFRCGNHEEMYSVRVDCYASFKSPPYVLRSSIRFSMSLFGVSVWLSESCLFRNKSINSLEKL